MKVRKRLLIVFIIGFLLMGIGGGIAFAEFSSFRYGGEKNMSGEMSTVKLYQTVPDNAEAIFIRTYGNHIDDVQIVEDNFLEKDQIMVEVTCDSKVFMPTLELQEEAENDGMEETAEFDDSEPEISETQLTEKEAPAPVNVAYLLDYYYISNDDLSEFFKLKDEFMECVKNRVVYSYYNDSIQGVVIKAPEELAKRIVIK